MNLALSPQVERFIQEQVQAGRFPNAEAVIESAIARFQETDEPDLDPETLARIDRSIDRIMTGGFREWSQASAELRKKYLGE